jgi:hypothetical protein
MDGLDLAYRGMDAAWKKLKVRPGWAVLMFSFSRHGCRVK